VQLCTILIYEYGRTFMGVNKININNNDSNYAHSIFDISEYTGKSYDTLTDALADVPDGKQKGGMTVSFVSTSDNNYVQFRCKTDDFSTNPDNWAICDDDILIENPNYIYTLTDNVGHLLCWLRSDGGVDWAIGVPKPVKDYVDAAVANIWNGNEGTSVDGLNKIIAFLNGFSTSETLASLLNSKVTKETGKSLISEDVAKSLSCIENSEYIDVETDNEGKIIEGLKKDGKKYIGVPGVFKEIYTNFLNLSEDGLQMLKNELEGNKKIVCWGDSLTVGAGYDDLTGYQTFCTSLISKGGPDLSARTNLNYPTMLKLMLGDRYSVANCGVGGETSYTIAARQGANPACLNNDIVLPATAGQTVDIVIGTNVGLLSSFDNTILVRPLLQGHGNSVNPVYVDGVKCILSVDSANYQASAYKLTRVENGDRDETIKAGTQIIMRGGYEHINTQFAVLFVGTNNGYSNNMLEVLKNMVSHLHSNKYIVVGLHGGTEATMGSFEKLLEKNFGDKFFNWRKYVSSNALYDFGFTPTAEDLSAMNVGSIPPTLLHDHIHLNAAGYGILGYMLYQRFINLGYNK